MSKWQLIMLSILLTYVASEFYCYSSMKAIFKEKSNLYYNIFYALTILLPVIGIGLMFFRFSNGGRDSFNPLTDNIWIGIAFSFMFLKVVLTLFLLIGDSLRAVEWASDKILDLTGNEKDYRFLRDRRNFLSTIALGLASIPFLSMVYGVTKGKYNYKVHKIKLAFKDLPKAFEGFTITQFSDFHAGSFDDFDATKFGIDLMDKQNSDLILFTGDLVNNEAKEAAPFIEAFSKMTAKEGKYSVLGNHDYGLYKKWGSQQEQQQNHQRMLETHKEAGFNLLLNQHVILERDGEKICLAGVENWGNKPFPQFGDIDATLPNEQMFTVLMSHDPDHWEEVVKDHPHQVHLTMAGHTHGMQFGVEILGFKWSPVKYRYKRWAGLYEEAKQYLYVNRGFGFIGFPGRVGIYPEITVFELTKA